MTIDYAFSFPVKGTSDYVKMPRKADIPAIPTMPTLTAFTVCFWMKSKNSQGTPFSYAADGQDNELLIEYERSFYLTIGGSKR